MKKIKWVLVGGIAILLIILIALVVFFFQKSHMTTEKVQLIVDERFQEIFADINEDGNYETNALKAYASITVEEITKDNDLITANCTIESINIGEGLIELLNALAHGKIDAARYEQEIITVIDSAEIFQTECVLTLSKNDNDIWVLDDVPYEIYNSYLGGYLTYAQKALELMEDLLNE